MYVCSVYVCTIKYVCMYVCMYVPGHRHLIKDDIPMPIVEREGEENVLSDREVSDAVMFMKNAKQKYPNQPWYIQVELTYTYLYTYLFFLHT